MRISPAICGILACLSASSAFAGDAYTLFNPVPTDQLRDFSPDRPGKTHSTATVDAGHFQLESDFLNYTYDRNSPDKQTSRALIVGAPLVKVGVLSNLDLEAGFTLYDSVHAKDRTTGATQNGDGIGDITLGGKYTIFGNGSDGSSLAFVPFVKLPVGNREVGNGRAEYTLNVPYAFSPGGKWALTLEPEVSLLKNSNDNNLHGDYQFLANLSHPAFTDSITAAIEVAGDVSGEPHSRNQFTLDPSLQWAVTANLQLDAGMYIGLNKAAPDLDAYTGVAVRF